MISSTRARAIMGKNIFGIEEAIRYFGMSESERASLADVPYSKEVLQRHKDSHILVAVVPISILDIRALHGELFQLEPWPDGTADHQDWYNDQPFAREAGTVGWQLVNKSAAHTSTFKSWDEQVLVLEANEQVPSTQVLVYSIIGHLKMTGERLLESLYVRCSDISIGEGNGDRIVVGFDSDDRLYIGGYADGDESRESTLGLASAISS